MIKFMSSYTNFRFLVVTTAVVIMVWSACKIHAFVPEPELGLEVAIRNSGIYDYCLENGMDGDGAEPNDSTPPDRN